MDATESIEFIVKNLNKYGQKGYDLFNKYRAKDNLYCYDKMNRDDYLNCVVERSNCAYEKVLETEEYQSVSLKEYLEDFIEAVVSVFQNGSKIKIWI